MKELSIEQKAKRYDELKVTAQELENDGCFDKITLFDLLPELKESEDKRIKKCIIDTLKNYHHLISTGGVTKEDMLDWLEKQGAHANFRNKIQVGDKVTRNKDGVLVNLSQLNRVAKKQGEHKPADNIPQDFEKYVEHLLSLSDGEGHGSPAKVKEVSAELFKLAKLEQKPAWSEEDEAGLSDALWAIKQARTIAKDENDMDNLWYAERWLKSLKDRYAWKPSDRQMKALNHINHNGCISYAGQGQELINLYNELKKLKC